MQLAKMIVTHPVACSKHDVSLGVPNVYSCKNIHEMTEECATVDFSARIGNHQRQVKAMIYVF